MKALIVDDKQLSADALFDALGRVAPTCERTMALSATEALELVHTQTPDVVFTDIEMPDMSGLELARRIKDTCAFSNIVFVTGHSSYALEAHGLYVSGYLLKPVSDADVRQALDNLRDPIEPTSEGMLQLRCFGSFEAFADGTPLRFERSKTKEMLAFLVDRKGARCTVGEIVNALWEDEPVTSSKRAQVRNLVHDLKQTLEQAGAQDAIIRYHGALALNRDVVSCDYYDFLHGDLRAINRYRGEYMSQYSWAELTAAQLQLSK